MNKDLNNWLLHCFLKALTSFWFVQVLEKVSETFGYRHLEDFMASHLDYLVLEWLNLQDAEYSLSSFPFILLNYTNVEDFYR